MPLQGGVDEPSGGGTPGIRQRIRYRFDNLLARGTSATLIWLGVVTIAAVAFSGLLLAMFGVSFAGSEETRWYEDMWQSLLRVMDTGTMASDVGWGRRILALLVTVFGLLVAGTLIGIIAAGVEDRIDSMRRGRSVVIESDHVVVLGASDRLPVLLRQLVLAADEGGSRTIVVLADVDPAEMHAVARVASGGRSDTRIVYRFGDPTLPDDLALVRLPAARGAIVLSDRTSDVTAAETVLAIAAERDGFDDLTVVVELLERDTARRLHRAFGDAIHSIVTSEAVARTTAFALRQQGLSQVMQELLDFRGADVHLVERPESIGATFGALVLGFEHARPIGIERSGGRIELAPPFESRVERGDRIIVIADDTEGLTVSDRGELPVTPAAGVLSPTADPVEERLVVIGWNALGRQVVAGWASSAATSSEVEVVVDPASVDPDAVDVPDVGPIRHVVTSSDDVISTVVERRPTTVVFLALRGDHDASDAAVILDVLALRRELAASAVPTPRLVIELHDADHVALVDLTGPDDFVISDAIGSHFIAQLVDQPRRRDVLLALYARDGASLRLVPCERFDLSGERTVAEMVEVVAARGLLLIGWRRQDDPDRTVTLNPHLGDRTRLAPGDEIIVIG